MDEEWDDDCYDDDLIAPPKEEPVCMECQDYGRTLKVFLRDLEVARALRRLAEELGEAEAENAARRARQHAAFNELRELEDE